MKRGFGLIEVLAAAVILGFLLIGLNTLQKGNRESILRVRARDAANVVAQDIIDSLSAIGSASVTVGERKCPNDYDETHDLCRTRIFTGTPSKILNNSMDIPVQYRIAVDVKPANQNQVAEHKTEYQQALATSGPSNSAAADYLNLSHQFAKQVEVTVNWKFKNSDQSINVSSVIR